MKAENDYIKKVDLMIQCNQTNMRSSIFECIYHCSGADEPQPQRLFGSGKIR